jgi:regulation of enolase protein 1 (concanavalin A-like superfamily)/mono/diheme cytochrome c family protein
VAKKLKDNQLRAWSHAGLFESVVDETKIATFARTVPLTDTAAPLEQRARSYLDANCAHCHRPGGVHALWDARFDTPLAATGMINGRPLLNIGINGAKIVKPGDTDHSALFRRIASLDPVVKMPPVARNTNDTAAIAVLRQWIDGLPPAADSLPKPWTAEDIGGVSQAGAGDTTFTNGTFTLHGGGNDVWGDADEFHFVSQPLHGDGQITARVASVGQTDGWAKAGVMIRDGSAPNAAHAFSIVTAGSGAVFQFREQIGGGSGEKPGPRVESPYWVRLERKGNVLSSFMSPNGKDWTKVGDTTIGMKTDVLIGLAVTAHNGGALCTATFDNVSVQAGK